MKSPDCSLNNLMQLLHQIQPLSKVLEETLIQGFEKVEVKKGRAILSEGDFCNHLWYLADGVAHSCIQYEGDIEDASTRIMLPEHIIISIYSYYNKIPSKETIEILKDSCLYKMSKAYLNNIYKNFPEFNLHGRVLTEQYLQQSERREALLRIPKASSRAKEFMAQYGHYLEHIPIKIAASFTRLSRGAFTSIKNNKYMGGR